MKQVQTHSYQDMPEDVKKAFAESLDVGSNNSYVEWDVGETDAIYDENGDAVRDENGEQPFGIVSKWLIESGSPLYDSVLIHLWW